MYLAPEKSHVITDVSAEDIFCCSGGSAGPLFDPEFDATSLDDDISAHQMPPPRVPDLFPMPENLTEDVGFTERSSCRDSFRTTT